MNKDPEVVTEQAPLIILYGKSDLCMSNNGKDTRHTRKFSNRMHFVKNSKECYMCKTVSCEGGLQLGDIGTKNVG